ncbi:MAG: response regulator [Burkholderiales bacterium]|nr:response regulator [Burkholderiales bacterium]
MLHPVVTPRQRAAQVIAVMLLLAVAVVDVVTPLGYAEWVLYFLPVAVTLYQPVRGWPIAVAAVATVLSIAGMLASPEGVDPALALINRSIGALGHCTLAGVVWWVLGAREQLERLLWLQQGQSRLSQALLGEQTLEQAAQAALRALCELLQAPVGAVYRLDGGELRLAGCEGSLREALPARLAVDEGLVAAVVRDGRPRLLTNVPAGHLDLVSSLGRSRPARLALGPLTADGQVLGVVELGFLGEQGASLDRAEGLLAACAEPAGTALRTAVFRQRQAELLEETTRQSEELQAQQEELRVSNEELEEHSRALQASQARLEAQQAELEQTNVQLEEQTQLLERQKLALQQTQQEMRAYAERLEQASRYKSEFLANMSHELRTPLNSALILSRLLADNRPGTLTPEQVEHARAIHSANNDLLALINDILDLSKIEAGRVDLVADDLALPDLLRRLDETFRPLTGQKHLQFGIEVAPDAPARLHTDAQRLQQILTNLLGNAVKFTQDGGVRLRVSAALGHRVRFDVVDTGMGIPRHQHEVIFEAFRQADGSTSRRFGGTGLGLSISRELAHRLGGSLTLDSEPGRGSTFSLELPVQLPDGHHATGESGGGPVAMRAPAVDAPASSEQAAAAAAARLPMDPAPVPAPGPAPMGPPVAHAAVAAAPTVPDDRAQRRHGSRLILAVEDDPAFAGALRDLIRERDFDAVVAGSAQEALQLAREMQPSGILLDIGLPDSSGLAVLESLKRDAATRHIPVHVVSAMNRMHTALELGAIGHLVKPATREALLLAIGQIEQRLDSPMRRLLIVEDDVQLRSNLLLLLSETGVDITGVGSVADAMDALQRQSFDCMVTDLSLPDGSGYDLLERMASAEHVSFPPVIVYTGRALTRDEEQRLRRYSHAIIVKGARSPERLLDEVTLFLHSVEASLPPERQRMLAEARHRDSVLDGRHILLAEDDVRNVFALTSVFEPLGVQLHVARNGREALERLASEDIDLVLMDVMMPEMDGLQAMQRIRQRPQWRHLPIIALTAKAMPDDRERCLQAGANDYVAKPIDIDKLVSLCRVWCPK